MPEAAKKIYLIEDDPAIIDIYETMMKKAHFNVETFSLGQEVLKKVRNIEAGEEVRPDLILLDLILPDMNGLEILTQIRRTEATKDTRVFILSNQADANMELGGVKPDKFIVKANVTPTQLLEIIQKELG